MDQTIDSLPRCGWSGGGLMRAYHDREWGAPVHDDRVLFEFLLLEGAQAGLSWSTILNKRENYRAALAGFDPAILAGYGPEQVALLLANPGIVRNRLKINAAITNARAFLEVQRAFGSFDAYLRDTLGGQPRHNAWQSMSDIPARTPESDRLSKDLQQRGFKFVGSTICYAFMQAVGLVNDHIVSCFRYQEIKDL